MFVPKPSQDLDQDLFCNRTVPVHQGTKDANVIANEQPSTSAVQTSPFIQELNLLFANQSFDEGKFESLADLIIKCSAEDAFDDIFAAHLFSLITTKSLFDGESENEELQLSAITAKIIYRTLKEGII